jgi:PAS domain S-box-containing protein
MRTHQDQLRRYGFALLTLALAAAVMAIPEIEDRAGTPILVYFFAVLLSAWYGGLGPGLLTTAVIVVMTSHTSFPFWRVVRLGLGIASGVSISALAEVLHAARRRAERNEQRFRALIEKGWDVISVVSADGVVRYASPTVTHTLGHAPEDFVGRDALELIHPDDRERVGRLLDELRGEPGASRGVDYRIRDKDGTWRWLEGTVTNLLTDAAVGGMVCNFRDVTGRKRAEEAQRLLAEAGAVLSSSLDDGATLDALAHLAVGLLADLCLIDMVQDDGAVLRAAAAHADPAKQALVDVLRCYSPDPRGPHPAMRALRSGRAEVTDQIDDAMLAATARNAAHLEVVRRLGFTSYLCIPLTARGRALGVLTLIGTDGHHRYDAADRALAEELARRAALAVDNARLYRAARQARQEAEAADRAKGRFLAVLSHELRTPLSPVLMAVSALLDGDEMLGLRPTLEMIRRNVELEARLIDDLLDVTRIGRGTLHLDTRTVDAHDAVRHAVHICLGEIEKGRISLESDLAASEHDVEADPARLQQIIWNLIKNATKFTPPGGSIAVRSRNQPPPGPGGRPRLVIEVADDGAGIEADALTRIFEPFEQGEVSPRHSSGLGLGLAIGRSLAEAHGGRLSAASLGPGQGSTFLLELPTITRPTVVKPPSGSAVPPLPQPRRLKILLVEDNKDTLKYIALVLSTRGHEVTVAERLSEALPAAADPSLDLLISDIELPDGTGLELMRQLRERGLPAIAMSGYGSEEDVRASLEAGFAAHLTKPVDLTQLIDAIHSVTAAERGVRAEGLGAAVRTS